MRTNDLRELTYTQLSSIKGIKEVYADQADADALYPHAVYRVKTITLDNLNRHDYVVEIDVWDKATSDTNIVDISDSILDLFNSNNLPQDSILPTFFILSNTKVEDEDKSIQHRNIEIQVQLYERS